jgi:hypothetical protein
MKNSIAIMLLLTSILAANGEDTFEFVVYLHGANEVPPNASPHAGSGSFALVGDVLTYNVALPLPTLSPADAGIYGPAGRGEAGGLILDWPTYQFSPPVPNSRQPPAILYVGSYALSAEQTAELMAGLWYVNIKSTNFPEGELRGQICPLAPEADCDGDGVPDLLDLCPDTIPGSVVDSNGCSIEQLVPCSGPWKTHKEYVKAVETEAFRFWKNGLISAAERNAVVKQAKASDCGNPPPPPSPPGPIVFPGPSSRGSFFGPSASP